MPTLTSLQIEVDELKADKNKLNKTIIEGLNKQENLKTQLKDLTTLHAEKVQRMNGLEDKLDLMRTTNVSLSQAIETINALTSFPPRPFY